MFVIATQEKKAENMHLFDVGGKNLNSNIRASCVSMSTQMKEAQCC